MNIEYIPVPTYMYNFVNILIPPLLTRTIDGVEMTTKHALKRHLELLNYMNKSKL